MSIDYGNGLTNIDHETGIRYGVISQNEVLQAWCDSSVPYYPETDSDDEIDDMAEPISFYFKGEGYLAECSRDDSDIFVSKSPFYTLADYCSPCAPGAGNLMTPGTVKTYCFGHDWFDGGKAPYPVYSVETGKLIEIEKDIK